MDGSRLFTGEQALVHADRLAAPGSILQLALILLLGTLLVELVRFWIDRKGRHFVCSKCGYAFKPTLRNYLRSGTSISASVGKMLTCPSCGHRDFLEPKRDLPV